MKKVFVSYSFQDSELYIVTLLFEKLRQNNIEVVSSEIGFDYDNALRHYTNEKIKNASLFIGIITNHSHSKDYVVNEWKIADTNNIQTILLIEEGIMVDDQNIQFIRFNRANPDGAINKILNINQPSIQPLNNENTNNLFAVGVIVLVVAGLIALLSGGSEKRY